MGQRREGVDVRAFPPDPAFVEHIGQALASGEHVDPNDLCEALRPAHPDVVIRPRDDLAHLAGPEVWYAYRDGEYAGSSEQNP